MENYPLIKNSSEKVKKTLEDDDEDEDKPSILPKISRPKREDKTKPALGETDQSKKFLEWLRGDNQSTDITTQEKDLGVTAIKTEADKTVDEVEPVGAIDIAGVTEDNKNNETTPPELYEKPYDWTENYWIRPLESKEPINSLKNRTKPDEHIPATEEISPLDSIQEEQNRGTEVKAEIPSIELSETGGNGDDGGVYNHGEPAPLDDDRRRQFELHSIDPNMPITLAINETIDNKAHQEAINDAAYIGEKRGLRRGLITGLLTGWYIERRHRKRVEKHMSKRLSEQQEAVEQLKKSERRVNSDNLAMSRKFEGLKQRYKYNKDGSFERPRNLFNELKVLKKERSVNKKLTPDNGHVVGERPVTAGHRLESSAWHSIEVDAKSGRAVDSPEIPYGKEFLHEQKQEKAAPLYRFGLTTKTAIGYTGQIGKAAIASTNKALLLMSKNEATLKDKSATGKAHLAGSAKLLINARPIIWGLLAVIVISILLLFFR